MSHCVFIDLGDGDVIKPSFSSKPTPAMIEEARQWGLEMKKRHKDMVEKGLCLRCEGHGQRMVLSADAPLGERYKMGPCPDCSGTGKAKPQEARP